MGWGRWFDFSESCNPFIYFIPCLIWLFRIPKRKTQEIFLIWTLSHITSTVPHYIRLLSHISAQILLFPQHPSLTWSPSLAPDPRGSGPAQSLVQWQLFTVFVCDATHPFQRRVLPPPPSPPSAARASEGRGMKTNRARRLALSMRNKTNKYFRFATFCPPEKNEFLNKMRASGRLRSFSTAFGEPSFKATEIWILSKERLGSRRFTVISHDTKYSKKKTACTWTCFYLLWKQIIVNWWTSLFTKKHVIHKSQSTDQWSWSSLKFFFFFFFFNVLELFSVTSIAINFYELTTNLKPEFQRSFSHTGIQMLLLWTVLCWLLGILQSAVRLRCSPAAAAWPLLVTLTPLWLSQWESSGSCKHIVRPASAPPVPDPWWWPCSRGVAPSRAERSSCHTLQLGRKGRRSEHRPAFPTFYPPAAPACCQIWGAPEGRRAGCARGALKGCLEERSRLADGEPGRWKGRLWYSTNR